MFERTKSVIASLDAPVGEAVKGARRMIDVIAGRACIRVETVDPTQGRRRKLEVRLAQLKETQARLHREIARLLEEIRRLD
mgnify:CR=1 FL=1